MSSHHPTIWKIYIFIWSLSDPYGMPWGDELYSILFGRKRDGIIISERCICQLFIQCLINSHCLYSNNKIITVRNIGSSRSNFFSKDMLCKIFQTGSTALSVFYTVVRSFATIICNCSVYNHFNKWSVTKSGFFFPKWSIFFSE